jgi:carbamoyltransferase
LDQVPMVSVDHHHSHAAAGYYTSGFKNAAILVVDAVGEWDTLSIWSGVGNRLTKIRSVRYPNSIGMFYSAMTQRCGFKPNEEEYIMMGMAALGDPQKYYRDVQNDLIELTSDWPFFRCKFNHHRGFARWRPDITDVANLAATAQMIFDLVLRRLSRWMHIHVNRRNLVISGGCALNCVTNASIARQWRWKKIWIMPNPGDAGNSLGATLAHHGKMVKWNGPYLGHEISGSYPVEELLGELLAGRMVGVANGRAEFGPRALGNRSLLADPRIPDIKDQMNQIKKREPFRPFSPVVLSSRSTRHFEDLNQDHSYMQYAVRCYQPRLYPGICHSDRTSRVQTVTVQQNPGLHLLLERWYEKTGCPMLVNTSLNIKSKPMVNDEQDAFDFEQETGIRVFTAARP